MLMNNSNHKQIKKHFIKYVIPSVMGMLVQALYVILDGIIVGQGIGEIALAAINIAFPYSMIVVALSMLIAVGGANIYSFHKGKGEFKTANNIFCQCILLSAVIGIILALLGFIFRESLSVLLGANDVLLPNAVSYLKWSAPFSVLQMVTFGLSVFIRNDDDPKTVMFGSVTGAVINAILDVIFILILNFGIEFAAITNGIGVSIELAFYCSHFIRKKGMLRIHKPVLHFYELKRILHNGMASALMEFSVPAVTFSFNLAVVHTAGTMGVSAYAIVSYVCAIINMVLVGVVQGAQPIMSLYHGKGEKNNFSYIYNLGVRANILASILLVGLTILFSEGVVALFHNGNIELTSLTVQMLRLYPLAFIFIGVTLMNILFFQTTERNSYAFFISLLRCIGFVQVFIMITIMAFGGKGLYLAFMAGEAFHCVISQLLIKRTIGSGNNKDREACLL